MSVKAPGHPFKPVTAALFSQGYHLLNAAPYVLTLLIMVITCSPKRTLVGAPAQLSITR